MRYRMTFALLSLCLMIDPVRLTGRNNSDMDAPQVIWDFFAGG
jgi:hypothetical protein